MVQQNQQQWKNEVFQKFEIQHDNQTVVDQFYTNLYGIHLLPSNRTGENPNWDNQDNIVYYDDFFTIWDTFRTLNPLINIINPTRGAEIVQSLANTYKTMDMLQMPVQQIRMVVFKVVPILILSLLMLM